MGWQQLVEAVYIQAGKDYRAINRTIQKRPHSKKRPLLEAEKRRIEAFLVSGAYNVDKEVGKAILEALQAETEDMKTATRTKGKIE